MKNPLWKRLPRELKSDFGKYIVIFLFMTLTIGFVSGFLVADDSMLAAYDEGFEKYNIEHGNFTLSSKASESDLKKIEKNGKVRICENFYRDEASRCGSGWKRRGNHAHLSGAYRYESCVPDVRGNASCKERDCH